jgi:hypothetical protein
VKHSGTSRPDTLKSFRRREAQQDNEDVSLSSVADQAPSSAKADETDSVVSLNSPSPMADAAFAVHDGACCSGVCERRVALLYFAAPKRLSNEFVDTIGAEPET